MKDRKTGEAFLEKKNQKHAIFNISMKFLPLHATDNRAEMDF